MKWRDWINIIVVIVIAVIGWVFFSPKASAPLISQQANGNSSTTVTQTATVNQIASYTWTNEDSWIAKPYQGTEFQTLLWFNASSSQILPGSACLSFVSDMPLVDVDPGYAMSPHLGKNSGDGQYTPYIYCYSGLTPSEGITLITNGKPTSITASFSAE